MMQPENLYRDIPPECQGETFEQLLDRPGVKLTRIVSYDHAMPDDEWYDQPEDEWVVLLQGSAKLAFEGESGLTELSEGDYLLIPAHCRHRVAWTSPEVATVWLALHVV